MPDFEKVPALMNTLPPEWQAVLDRLWEVNVVPDYRNLVDAFVREYYRIELAKTSTLRLSATWRRVNAPWWRHESSPKVFPWLANVPSVFSDVLTNRLEGTFPIYFFD